MAVDFSALDEQAVLPAATGTVVVSDGKPLFLPLADIEEDENQPRKEFDLTDLRASIKAKIAAGKPPIKTPVSVKTHPTKPGKWLLNDGARRYRASVAEELAKIPAFVDEEHDDYDQVIVNIQRHGLKGMEMALFIKKRMKIGESKKTIASNLGYDPSFVTHHLALIDAPDCVMDAYRTGRCKSPKTLYEFRNLHEQFPQEVQQWYESAAEITRAHVDALAVSLKEKALSPEVEQVGAGSDDGESKADEIGHQGVHVGNKSGGVPFGHDQERSVGIGKAMRDYKPVVPEKTGTARLSPASGGRPVAVQCCGADTGALASGAKEDLESDPLRLSKPILLVEINGRIAAVLLTRRPSRPGLLPVRFEDGGGELEVEAACCTVNQLIDGA